MSEGLSRPLHRPREGTETERTSIAWLPPALALFLALYAVPLRAAVHLVFPDGVPSPASALGVGAVALLGALTVLWPYLVPDSGDEEKELPRTRVLPVAGWVCTVLLAVAASYGANYSADQLLQTPQLWFHFAFFAYGYRQAQRISRFAAAELDAWRRWRQYGRRVVQLPPRRSAEAFRETYVASIVALCLLYIAFDALGPGFAERWADMALVPAAAGAITGLAVAVGLENLELHITWEMRGLERLPVRWARPRLVQGIWIVLVAGFAAFMFPRVPRLIDVRAIQLPAPPEREFIVPELPQPFGPPRSGELSAELTGPLFSGLPSLLEWAARVAVVLLVATGLALAAVVVRRAAISLPGELQGLARALAAVVRDAWRTLRGWWTGGIARLARPFFRRDAGVFRVDPIAHNRYGFLKGGQLPRDVIRRVYRRWLARAKRAGYARRRGETPREFADRLQARLNYEEGQALYELTRLYERSRYGPSLSRDEERIFGRRARELWRTLGRSLPKARAREVAGDRTFGNVVRTTH